MSETLVIYSRLFDLMHWLLPKSEGFPGTYRNTVTRRLMDAVLDLNEYLIEAGSNSGRRRQALLQEADARLQKLRVYLRLVHQWGWLSGGQYLHVSRMVEEIGRLLGGWIKQSKSKTKGG